MQLSSEMPKLRRRAEVRASVDAKLGNGSGLSPREASALLTPPERVEWILAELLVGILEYRHHGWMQTWSQAKGVDTLRVVGALAHASARLHPKVSALLQWTVERAGRLRNDGEDEPFASIVPEVWSPHIPSLEGFLTDVVERWPETVDPLALPDPRLPARPITAPATGSPRYPMARVGLTGAGTGCELIAPAHARGAIGTVAHALWAAGASDRELESFVSEAGRAAGQLPEVCARWILVDGLPADRVDFEAIRQRLFPLHPLNAELGVQELRYPVLALVEPEALERLSPLVEQGSAIRVKPRPDAPFAQVLRAALRSGCDEVLLAAEDLDGDAVELVLQALDGGVAVVVAGSSPDVQALRDAATNKRIPVRQGR